MDQIVLPHYNTGDTLTAQEFNKLPSKVNELVEAINSLSETARDYIQITTLDEYNGLSDKDSRTLYLCVDEDILTGVFIGEYSIADLESDRALPIEQQITPSTDKIPSSMAVLQALSAKLSSATLESGASSEIAADQPDNAYSIQRMNAILSALKAWVSETTGGLLADVEFDSQNTKITKTLGTETTDVIGPASTESGGLMTPDMVSKLNDVEEGANKTLVDPFLSEVSANPVENRVVHRAMQFKANLTDIPEGVYVGDDMPGEHDAIWIDPNGESNEYISIHVGEDEPDNDYTALWINPYGEANDFYSVYVGENEPTDNYTAIWIDPNGAPDEIEIEDSPGLKMSTHTSPNLHNTCLFINANFNIRQKLDEGYEFMLFRRISTSSHVAEGQHRNFKGWRHYTKLRPVVQGNVVYWLRQEGGDSAINLQHEFVTIDEDGLIRLSNGKKAKRGRCLVGHFALGLGKPRLKGQYVLGSSPESCIAWTEFDFIVLYDLHNALYCTFMPK